MAVYKVAQDVEADDKLLGPFTFRQFIYLIIVAISIALAWGLSRLFLPLAIIPLPIILFFGALALPLRKDQPMEIYLAAILSFYLKPRKRLWMPDGVEQLVEITAPHEIEVVRAKELTQSEAQRRFSYLADIADSGGWAVRGISTAPQSSPMIHSVYDEAQKTEDILDTSGALAQSFDTRIAESTTRHRQQVISELQQANIDQQIPASRRKHNTPAHIHEDTENILFNPYPTSIHQSIIQPISVQEEQHLHPAEPTINTNTDSIMSSQTFIPQDAPSQQTTSPDIINLVSNPDLSIETIQHEANRIRKRQEAEDGEVFIPLH